jgi:hypothetical protein
MAPGPQAGSQTAKALGLQEGRNRDLGSLIDIVASIGERVRDGCHCRTNPKVRAKVMINAPNQ